MNNSLSAPLLRRWWFWAGVAVLALAAFYTKGYLDYAGDQAIYRYQGIQANSYWNYLQDESAQLEAR